MVFVGVMGAYSAVSSGKEATLLPAFSEQASAVDASQGNVYEVLMEHSSNAKLASHAFAVLMVLLLLVILASDKLRLEKKHTSLRLVLAAWLVLAMGAMVLLGIAGHGGARLVHELGIHAAL
jgi:uncharacterized membrane protein